jgi:hypothetical protein
LAGSTLRVATKQSISVNSSYFIARRPISVVQTAAFHCHCHCHFIVVEQLRGCRGWGQAQTFMCVREKRQKKKKKREFRCVPLWKYEDFCFNQENLYLRVKSAGWLKRIAHLPFFHSWNLCQ